MTGNNQNPDKKKHVVIHGHFYQPPRENPWLNIIEKQESAAPDHDWNERIYNQCYRPNATSRILDSKGMIVDIHNNYKYMSYNFGPTLFSWLEQNHPKIAHEIIAADADSKQRLNHGNALAQVYNHIIMPLASRRDQLTQIRWAKTFFEKRFRRPCEGMWLAETAINMETVTCLIEENIKFVILSPTQAHSIRLIDNKENWSSVSDGRIDTRITYRFFPRSKDGTKLNGYLDIFFFDEGLSREVSFGGLLNNASTLGSRINNCFDDSAEDQIVVIATDGETFGHHKPFGDMCLAYFFNNTAKEMDIVPVNFAFFLEKNPPKHEVMLKNEFGEGTAWSCQHGVGRWSRDCGCNAGGPPTWNQAWRAPLRTAFDILQKSIDSVYECDVKECVPDPWALRDKYLDIADYPMAPFKKALIELGASENITANQMLTIRRLLEAQKFMLFAYTSCGWFFSELSGIETVQNIASAGRALTLALSGEEYDKTLHSFLENLHVAKSNVAEKDGSLIFSSLVQPYFNHLSILCFTALVEKILTSKNGDIHHFEYYGYKIDISLAQSSLCSNKSLFELHKIAIKNEKTGETGCFLVLNEKDTVEFQSWCLPETKFLQTASALFDIDTFKNNLYTIPLSLSAVFNETKEKISTYYINIISEDTQNKYASWMDNNRGFLDSLTRLDMPLPSFIKAPVAYVLTHQWKNTVNAIEIYGQEEAVFAKLLDLWHISKKYSVEIDFAESAHLLLDLLLSELKIFSETLSIVSSDRMRFLLNIIDRFSIPFSKNKIEDSFFVIFNTSLRTIYNEFKTTSLAAEKEKLIKLLHFAKRMNFNTDSFPLS